MKNLLLNLLNQYQQFIRTYKKVIIFLGILILLLHAIAIFLFDLPLVILIPFISLITFMVMMGLKGVQHPFYGIYSMIKTQLNFRIEIACGFLVVLAGLIVGLEKLEWVVIVFTIFFVLICEAINSVIETICDLIDTRFNWDIKYAKDVSSGVVLLAAIASVIIGLIIFLPYAAEYITA